MDTAQGTVSNCQHTIKVSGGANNTSTSTTYIALFRVNGRPVQFRSSQPSSVSDGDNVAVAGLMWGQSLDALACRNLTTGEVMDSGVWSYVFGAIILTAVAIVICVVVGNMFGNMVQLLIAVVVLAIAVYLLSRAVLTSRAIKAVGG